MARIRSVHPSLFTDEAWVSCSPIARILYIGLWTDADDQGVFEWRPLQLKMRLLPGDGGAEVSTLLDELAAVDLIQEYEIDGKRLGAIKNFRKFQRPQKPNAIHPITENIELYVCLSATDTKPVSDQSRTDPVIPQQMEDGEEDVREEIERPKGLCRPQADALPVQEAFDRWNELAQRKRLPVAKSMTPQRRKAIRSRLAEAGIVGWNEALAAVAVSPLCLGENDRGWRADLDFVCQPKSFSRLREGFYAPKASGLPSQRSGVEAVSPELLARHQAMMSRRAVA